MPIAQALILLYTGMLIESPQKREQFVTFVNKAGESLEKSVKEFMSKGGAVNNEPSETATEPEEFR